MKKYIIALVILVLVLVAGYFYWQQNKSVITDPGQVACTMEAKICPDGVTYVGRQGPKCEFQACPVSTVVSKPVTQVVKDSFFWIDQPFLKSDSIAVNTGFFGADFIGLNSGPNPYAAAHSDSPRSPTDIIVSWGDGSPVEHNCKDISLGHTYTKVGTYKVGVKVVTLKSCDDLNSIVSVLDEKEYTAVVSNWISGWKTYRSDIHNLEFKYPADWKIVEGKDGHLNLENPNRSSDQLSEGLAIIPIDSNDIIGTCIRGGNYNRVYLDDVGGKSKDTLDSGWENLDSKTDMTRTLCFDGTMISISGVTVTGQKIFDKILSTFKFI